MSKSSASEAPKWMEEPTMPIIDGLLSSGLINLNTRIKLKEIEPNLKDEYQNRNIKKINKTASSMKRVPKPRSKDDKPQKSTNSNEIQESHVQKRKLLHLNQSSVSSHSKTESPSINESTSKYLSFANPPPNFSIQDKEINENNENINSDNFGNISIGIPIDELLLSKKKYVGKREIQHLLTDYLNKLNSYTKTIADSQMKQDSNFNDPSFQYKELQKMLTNTFASWNSAITIIRCYSDGIARLLYEIKKFFQQRVDKFPEIVEKFEEKILNLDSINNSQKDTITQINSSINIKDNEINLLNKKVDELSSKIASLEKDKEGLIARIYDIQYSKDHLEEEYHTTVFRLNRTEEEKKQSVQNLQSIQEILESCKDQIAQQETLLEKFEEEGAGFRPLYTKVSFENQQYIKDLNELREKMKNMVVKQETVSVQVQTSPVKIVNETKSKRNANALKRKASRKLTKMQSTITVRNIFEKYDPNVLNSTSTTTPEKKKKKIQPSSTSKKANKKSVISPSAAPSPEDNATLNVNPNDVVSPYRGGANKKQGILNSSENFGDIIHCVSFESVSEIFDLKSNKQYPTRNNYAGNAGRLCKSHAHLLKKDADNYQQPVTPVQNNKSKSANLTPAVTPIVDSGNTTNLSSNQTSVQSSSQSPINEIDKNYSSTSSASSSAAQSPIQLKISSCITTPNRRIPKSPSSPNIISTLPLDYDANMQLNTDPQVLISCVYRLLPLPFCASSAFIHRSDPQVEFIMRNFCESNINENPAVIKSFNWMIQRIVDFFHSILNFEQISNISIDSVDMLRTSISEKVKIGALTERWLKDLIRTAMLYKNVPIVSVFLKVIMFELTTSEYKFLNMLFNIAFEYIYPSIKTLIDDPELSPSSPSHQFLIHRKICEEISGSIFKHSKKEAISSVQSILSNSKYPDFIDFWEYSLKMTSLFTENHKQFQRQIRTILTLARLKANPDENIKDSYNNDNTIVTKQNFVDFVIFINPIIKNKEIESLYERFSLECKNKIDREHLNNNDEIANTQYNFIHFCSDFPDITEYILSLKCKEEILDIYKSLTDSIKNLFHFIMKRFTDYVKFTQPRLLSPLLEMTRPVLIQMRNAILRCDVSMSFSCYRHILQLIDLKCSEACPFTIFNENIDSDSSHEVMKLFVAREKIAASHLFEKLKTPPKNRKEVNQSEIQKSPESQINKKSEIQHVQEIKESKASPVKNNDKNIQDKGNPKSNDTPKALSTPKNKENINQKGNSSSKGSVKVKVNHVFISTPKVEDNIEINENSSGKIGIKQNIHETPKLKKNAQNKIKSPNEKMINSVKETREKSNVQLSDMSKVSQNEIGKQDNEIIDIQSFEKIEREKSIKQETQQINGNDDNMNKSQNATPKENKSKEENKQINGNDENMNKSQSAMPKESKSKEETQQINGNNENMNKSQNSMPKESESKEENKQINDKEQILEDFSKNENKLKDSIQKHQNEAKEILSSDLNGTGNDLKINEAIAEENKNDDIKEPNINNDLKDKLNNRKLESENPQRVE